MPNKDLYHEVVIQALKKSGWMVAQEQTTLRIGKRRLWIDVLALHFTNDNPILVEIKVFERIRSYVDYLSASCGQYGLYKGILKEQGIHIPLYMAIPVSAFNGIFKEAIGQVAIRQFDIQFIVFDPEKAEIITWTS